MKTQRDGGREVRREMSADSAQVALPRLQYWVPYSE
jgi:hypothetical protein